MSDEKEMRKMFGSVEIGSVIELLVDIIKNDQRNFDALRKVADERMNEIRGLEIECKRFGDLYVEEQVKVNRILDAEAKSDIKAITVLDRMQEEKARELANRELATRDRKESVVKNV